MTDNVDSTPHRTPLHLLFLIAIVDSFRLKSNSRLFQFRGQSSARNRRKSCDLAKRIAPKYEPSPLLMEPVTAATVRRTERLETFQTPSALNLCVLGANT